MIAIFYTELEASEFAKKTHEYLLKYRKGYKANKWSDIIKADKELKWGIKIPDDKERKEASLSLDSTVKEQITKYPDDWVSSLANI